MKNTSISCSDLPPELITEILLRVPADDLQRFKCVSKHWRDEINSERFIKQHLSHSLEASSYGSFLLWDSGTPLSSINFDGVAFRATNLPDLPAETPCGETLVIGCGLVCFVESGHYSLYNPATRAYRRLPQSKKLPRSCKFSMTWKDFGYDYVNNDYKVVCFSYYDSNRAAHVYSLKSDSWTSCRAVGHVGTEVTPMLPMTRGVLVNNALHWAVNDGSSLGISAFDLGNEDFHEVPMPGMHETHDGFLEKLSGIRGCLYLLSMQKGLLQIWVMKEYGVKASWTKVFSCSSMSFEGSYYPGARNQVPSVLSCSKDGQKLLIGRRLSSGYFGGCDLQSQAIKFYNTEVVNRRNNQLVYPWVSSLVSVNPADYR